MLCLILFVACLLGTFMVLRRLLEGRVPGLALARSRVLSWLSPGDCGDETFVGSQRYSHIEEAYGILFAVEKAIVDETNFRRMEHGLSPLMWDEDLSEVAREHSEDMADNGFFSHENLDGESPSMRADRHGLETQKPRGNGVVSVGIGENIHMLPAGHVVGVGYVDRNPHRIASAQVDSWMDSPGHRRNVLSNEYTRIGVGVAHDGTYYFSTQNFW
jgi:uncharacterized protein YkwD